ncbi:MAG: hypothetical protein WA324_23725 [Bryobacteraceae bacterium]
MLLTSIRVQALLLSLGILTVSISAKDKRPKPAPQDQIQIIAHIPAAGDNIVGFLTTRHYEQNYLYAEHQSGNGLTLIDITDLKNPTIVAQMSEPVAGVDNLVAAAGNVALVATANQQAQAAAQTFRILSFADPGHPAVEREFKGVTATARDDKRGLIFLANSDGIWILQQQFAMDPNLEKQWEHDVLGAH